MRISDWSSDVCSSDLEREIAARFGVSHAPVREAFRHLARIGLVKVVPWRGTYVIDIDEHAANEVYELWKSLFGVVCRLAAVEMTDRDGRELMHRLVDYKAVTKRTENTFDDRKSVVTGKSVSVGVALGW